MNLDKETLMKYGIAAGILYAGWKYGNGPVKAGALAVAAVVLAKRTPYLNQVI